MSAILAASKNLHAKILLFLYIAVSVNANLWKYLIFTHSAGRKNGSMLKSKKCYSGIWSVFQCKTQSDLLFQFVNEQNRSDIGFTAR